MSISIRQIRNLINDHKIEFIDLKFTDLPGTWQHFSLPVEVFRDDAFTEGLGFDGSSIRGFQRIEESDMLIRPDPATAFVDPFADDPTLSFICNVKDPATLQLYSRDPRNVAQKAERFIEGSGIADAAYFGPEAEFYIFDDVRYDQAANQGFYLVDSVEGQWNTGRNDSPNLGHKPRFKEGYFPAPPTDTYQNLRAKMVRVCRQVGVKAEVHHHEVGSGGQSEIDLRYDRLVSMGDQLMTYKYVIKNVAARHNKTVTFMPKPIFEDNGSGMHVHVSLWKNGRNLFFQEGTYANLSRQAVHFIGGILEHAPSLLALCAPTTNSYRRLVPGFEAPVNLMYSERNRSACVRIPAYSQSERAKRLEFRCPDPSCNPYLAFAAILMAGVDGMGREIEPPAPIDKDLYELPPDVASGIKSTPANLEEAIRALEEDHEYLLRGDVFTEDVIRTWIDYKRERELDFVRVRPHPAEFALYYDV
jgi:glutamine synthetase